MKTIELPRLLLIACLSVGVMSWTACGSEESAENTVDSAVDAAGDAADAAADAAGDAAGDAADAADAAIDAAAGDATAAAGDGTLSFEEGTWGWNIYNYMNTGSGSKTFNLDKIPMGDDEEEASAEGKQQLDDLAAILNAYPDITCQVQGHTKEAKNAVDRGLKQAWSKARALWVQSKMAARGVDKKQMEAKGMADKELMEGVAGDDASQRRVVVVFTK